MAASYEFTGRLRSSDLRGVVLLKSLVVVAVLLAACGAPNPSVSTPAPTPDTPTELLVYMPQSDYLAGLLEALMKAAPGGAKVNVKLTFLNLTADPLQQIPALVSQGKPPDLILVSNNYAAYLVGAGLLLDVRDQMSPDAQFDPEAIDERALAAGRVPGRGGQYALPVWMNDMQLYYNKTLLQRAKVQPPSPDWTWDDLVAQCKQLQAALPGVTCLALYNATYYQHWYPWVRGYGGDLLSADGTRSTLGSPQALEGLRRYQELWTKHKIMAPVQFPTQLDCFVGQRCAMMTGYAGTDRVLTERVGGTFAWDTQLLPKFPRGRYTTGEVTGFGVGAASKHPAAAWALLKSFTSPAAQGALLAGGFGLPVLKDIPPVAGWQMPAYLKPFLDGRASSLLLQAYPTTPACGDVLEGKMGAAVQNAFSAVFYRDEDLAKVLPQADEAIQQCLDAAGSPSPMP